MMWRQHVYSCSSPLWSSASVSLRSDSFSYTSWLTHCNSYKSLNCTHVYADDIQICDICGPHEITALQVPASMMLPNGCNPVICNSILLRSRCCSVQRHLLAIIVPLSSVAVTPVQMHNRNITTLTIISSSNTYFNNCITMLLCYVTDIQYVSIRQPVLHSSFFCTLMGSHFTIFLGPSLVKL